MGAFEKFQGDFAREFKDGEIIFFEDDEGREMYIIQKGKVAISRKIDDQNLLLSVKGRGDFIGEMALLESLPRSATATAVGHTKLLVVHAGGFLQKIRRDPTFAFEMLQRMSARFRILNDQMRELLQRVGVKNPELIASIFAQYDDVKPEPEKVEYEGAPSRESST